MWYEYFYMGSSAIFYCRGKWCWFGDVLPPSLGIPDLTQRISTTDCGRMTEKQVLVLYFVLDTHMVLD